MDVNSTSIVNSDPSHSSSPAQQRTRPPSRLEHGLLSRSTVIPGESEAEFAAYRQELMDDLNPEDRDEANLVEQMAQAQWHLHRVWAQEAGVYHQYEREHPAEPGDSYSLRSARCFMADCKNGRSLDRLSGQMTRLVNAYHKAARELARRRKGSAPPARRRQEPALPVPPEAAATSWTEAGSVESADGPVDRAASHQSPVTAAPREDAPAPAGEAVPAARSVPQLPPVPAAAPVVALPPAAESPDEAQAAPPQASASQAPQPAPPADPPADPPVAERPDGPAAAGGTSRQPLAGVTAPGFAPSPVEAETQSPVAMTDRAGDGAGDHVGASETNPRAMGPFVWVSPPYPVVWMIDGAPLTFGPEEAARQAPHLALPAPQAADEPPGWHE